jgi:hypothetical protein
MQSLYRDNITLAYVHWISKHKFHTATLKMNLLIQIETEDGTKAQTL